MNYRKIKRICDVRGCKSTDCFVIAKSREVGNSVIICKQCLKEALAAVKDYVPEPKRETVTDPPPLFFNAEKVKIMAETAKQTEIAAELEKPKKKKESVKA